MKQVSNAERGDLRKLQLTELEILKEIVKVCKKNNIRYYLMGGTFLGAVRHKGFIPWDDDIDISMPREDYDKFFEIAENELPEKLVCKNFKKWNEKTIYFSRIEDPSVKIEDSSAIKTRIRSVWVDVFPLDGMPNNAIIRSIHKLNLLYKRATLQYSHFSEIVNQDLPNRPWHESILIKVGNVINFEKIFNTDSRLRKLDNALRRYSYDKSKYVVNLMGAYKFREMFPKEIYNNTSEYQFETERLTAPSNYDKVLSQMYGEYMKVPPEHQQNKHHSKVIKEN